MRDSSGGHLPQTENDLGSVFIQTQLGKQKPLCRRGSPLNHVDNDDGRPGVIGQLTEGLTDYKEAEEKYLSGQSANEWKAGRVSGVAAEQRLPFTTNGPWEGCRMGRVWREANVTSACFFWELCLKKHSRLLRPRYETGREVRAEAVDNSHGSELQVKCYREKQPVVSRVCAWVVEFRELTLLVWGVGTSKIHSVVWQAGNPVKSWCCSLETKCLFLQKTCFCFLDSQLVGWGQLMFFRIISSS